MPRKGQSRKPLFMPINAIRRERDGFGGRLVQGRHGLPQAPEEPPMRIATVLAVPAIALLTACAGDEAPPPRDSYQGPVYGARGADVPQGLPAASSPRHDASIARLEPTDPRPLRPQQAETPGDHNPL